MKNAEIFDCNTINRQTIMARIWGTGVRKNKWNQKYKITFMIIAIVLIAIAGIIAQKILSDRSLLYIDERKIGEEEYQRAVFQARNNVQTRLAEQGITIESWDMPTDSGIPYEMAAEQAIHILQEYYAVSTLAVQCGYLENADFDELKKELEEENKNRQAEIMAGKVVTGLDHFEIEQYMQYRADQIRQRYCADNKNTDMNISEEELHKQYECDKDIYYTCEDDLKLSYLELDLNLSEFEGYDSLQMEQQVQRVRETAISYHSLEKALEEFPNLKPFYKTIDIKGENYASYEKAYAELLAYAGEISSGEITDVINEYEKIYLIFCTDRVNNGYISFEKVSGIVEKTVRERKYDDLIQERIKKQKVKFNEEKLYSYTARQLR